MLVDLGLRISLIRKAKKLTQDECATACGVSKAAFRNYESGSRTPNIEFAYAALTQLDVSPTYLFFGQEPMFAFSNDPINDEAQAYKALAEQRKAENQQLKSKISKLEQRLRLDSSN